MQLLARERLLGGISQFDADEFAITADRFKHLWYEVHDQNKKDFSRAYLLLSFPNWLSAIGQVEAHTYESFIEHYLYKNLSWWHALPTRCNHDAGSGQS